MPQSTSAIPVGRVLRSALSGFVIGCQARVEQLPAFGSLVKTDAAKPVLGLVYDIAMSDDLLVKQLAVTENVPEEVVQDQIHSRRLPVEISVLAVGYFQERGMQQGTPPRPPLSLDHIFLCPDDELRAFTERFDYLRRVLNSPEVPADELLVAHLRQAAAARPPRDAQTFLEDAGRELAHLLGRDLLRLDGILPRLACE
jgi:hypothetical protein